VRKTALFLADALCSIKCKIVNKIIITTIFICLTFNIVLCQDSIYIEVNGYPTETIKSKVKELKQFHYTIDGTVELEYIKRFNKKGFVSQIFVPKHNFKIEYIYTELDRIDKIIRYVETTPNNYDIISNEIYTYNKSNKIYSISDTVNSEYTKYSYYESGLHQEKLCIDSTNDTIFHISYIYDTLFNGTIKITEKVNNSIIEIYLDSLGRKVCQKSKERLSYYFYDESNLVLEQTIKELDYGPGVSNISVNKFENNSLIETRVYNNSSLDYTLRYVYNKNRLVDFVEILDSNKDKSYRIDTSYEYEYY